MQRTGRNAADQARMTSKIRASTQPFATVSEMTQTSKREATTWDHVSANEPTLIMMKVIKSTKPTRTKDIEIKLLAAPQIPT